MKILFTGALGNVGNNVLKVLVEDGHDVTAFELQTKITSRRHAKLSKSLDYSIVWGNITKEEEVAKVLEDSQPDVVLHLAGIVPPNAYLNPRLSEAVNVGGTEYLIKHMNSMEKPPRLVFSSSYSCCGAYNGAKEVVLQTGETPANARDLYGRQKQTCEELIKSKYDGPYVILRFCRIVEAKQDYSAGGDSLLRFLQFMPAEQRCHGAHPADIGRACLNACKFEEAVGRTFAIGGDDSWKLKIGEMTADLLDRIGLVGISDYMYRRPNPDVDESWYFETWMDTTESQRILKFQTISYQDFLKEVKRSTRLQWMMIRPFAPLARRAMYYKSPFYKENKNALKNHTAPSEKTSWEVLVELFPTAPTSYDVPT